MACPKPLNHPQTYVPVCASVLCEAPGVIYVNIDPDVWKIRCRQCQEKTEHKCALKKLKNKFRGDPSKRRKPKEPDPMTVFGEKLDGEEKNDSSEDLAPPPALGDNFCACADRPRDVPPKANTCLCEIYKPLNFLFELEVTGEFKPAYMPKPKKGKE